MNVTELITAALRTAATRFPAVPAGIGENDAATRLDVMRGCAWLGVAPEEARNAAASGRISAEGPRIPVWVIAMDQERMIARHMRTCVSLITAIQ